MNMALWIAQALLAAIFLFAGGMKLVVPIEEMTKQMPIPLPGVVPPFHRHCRGVRRDRSDRPLAPAHTAGSDTARRRRAGDRYDRRDRVHAGGR